MKKLLILSLALALALSLAACGDNSGGNSSGGLGDITVSGGSSEPSSSSGDSISTADPTQSTPGTSQQPGETTSLVGQWSNIYDKPFDEADKWIEFKSDGTFLFHYYKNPYYWSAVQGKLVLSESGGGTWEIKGCYEVKGDKIYCTNLLYTWKDALGSSSNYTDRSGIDCAWSFYFSDEHPSGSESLKNGHKWLCINIQSAPDENFDTSQSFSFQKPIK